MAMCWDCGGERAANGGCFHWNPNPARLEAAKKAQPTVGVKTQKITCPDCSAVLEVAVNLEGAVHVLHATHRT